MAWKWRCAQTYAWRSKQHINVLELVAFFICLRSNTRSADNHSLRILHVLHGKVVSCVLSEGKTTANSTVLQVEEV